MSLAPDRLDSWKAIGEYLGRDVRTLRRWEDQGLPVRRVGGGRGSSVFAFKSEIDLWLRAHADRPLDAQIEVPAPAPVKVLKPDVPAAPREVTPPSAPLQAPSAAALAATTRARNAMRFRWATAGLLITVAIVGWTAWAPSAARQLVVAKMTVQGLTVSDDSGRLQWRQDVPANLRAVLPYWNSGSAVIGEPRPAVLSMTSYFMRKDDEMPFSGELRQFSLDGRLEEHFSFDDSWTFATKTYGAPWALADFRVDDSFGRRQIAVTAHHYTWWPSIVTVLDERFQRQGTFVNSGWVDMVRWLSPDHLGISGFNQARDGGMFGVLDAHGIDGTSPEVDGSPYDCASCRPGRPVMYAVFPRSELNRVTGSPFNRATIDVNGHGVIAHTAEMEAEAGSGLTEAVYEFSPTFELVSATYGSRYWDKHRALELQGKITHTRETCPERDGPPFVWIWTRAAGWKKVTTSRSSRP